MEKTGEPLGTCDGCRRTLAETTGTRYLCGTHGGEWCEECWTEHQRILHQPAPPIGSAVLCLVCAYEKPWGTWHPHGVAVCKECRDAAQRAGIQRQIEHPFAQSMG